jgi:hypothetical protein
VLRASVARGDVLALFVERLESEILALPEHVTVEAVESVADEPPRAPGEHVEIAPA